MEKVKEDVTLAKERVYDFFDELDANYQQQLIWKMRAEAQRKQRMSQGEFLIGDEIIHHGQVCVIQAIDAYLPRGYLIQFKETGDLKYIGKYEFRPR